MAFSLLDTLANLFKGSEASSQNKAIQQPTISNLPGYIGKMGHLYNPANRSSHDSNSAAPERMVLFLKPTVDRLYLHRLTRGNVTGLISTLLSAALDFGAEAMNNIRRRTFGEGSIIPKPSDALHNVDGLSNTEKPKNDSKDPNNRPVDPIFHGPRLP